MPPNDSLPLEEDQCPIPSLPEPPQDHAKEFVG
jgi:hypothetical protein